MPSTDLPPSSPSGADDQRDAARGQQHGPDARDHGDPAGTERKINFYLFAAAPPSSYADLPGIKESLRNQLDRMEADLRALVGV